MHMLQKPSNSPVDKGYVANSYISSCHDWDTDKIMVWERPVTGGPRTVEMYDAPRYFYVPDPDGAFVTITGERVKKLSFETEDEFKTGLKQNSRRFESDIRPEARLLMDRYYGRATPIIHYAFLDIEVDYSSKIGWSSAENPYAAINAITIYQSWTGKYLTYAVPPKGWKGNEVDLQKQIVELWAEHKLGFTPDVTICQNERDLLLYMLGDLEDADIISGWNSEFFDNPYIIERLSKVLGKRGVNAMSFVGAKSPKERTIKRFGSDAKTYTLYGRTHLDYLDLFKKFTFEGRVSYSLGNIAAEELDIPKLDYPGTLEQLYHNDFAHFITYNARDVEVLVKLDVKYKLMQLVNQMAHENTVPYLAILGTVRYVETGVLNRSHNVHNLICSDKVIPTEDNEKVEGAIVMTPLAGLHSWAGSVDLTSLYPSVDRSLNMSVETFIGQFVDEEKAWAGIRAKDDNQWVFDLGGFTAKGGDTSFSMTGAEWWQYLRDENFGISAFGTVFDQNKPGMLSDTLTFWFEERKRLQAEKKKYYAQARDEKDLEKKKELEKLVDHYDLLQLTKKIQLNSAYGATLNEAFRFGRREIGASITGTGRQITKHMIQTIGEVITGRKVRLEKRYIPGTHTKSGGRIPNRPVKRDNEPKRTAFVNGYEHMYSKEAKSDSKETAPYAVALRNGDTETLMKGLPSEIEYSWEKNPDTKMLELTPTGAIYFTVFDDDNTHCDVIIYGDTDSCYFKTNGTTYEEAVALADDIAARTNASFPAFMAEAFNCTPDRSKLIKAAREIVAERGLFLMTKKKYTLRVVNLDGNDMRKKPKLKSMGSEIKKADTPKVVQDFLKDLMELVLTGEEYDVLEKFINTHRGTLIGRDADVLSLAPAKQVNNLDEYYAEFKRTEKVGRGKMKTCPGHVRAAINYNEMIELFDPGNAKPMRAGDKAAILYLCDNTFGFRTIGFPTDLMHLPEWFTEHFKVDLKITEEKMIDSKIVGIFEALQLELPTIQQSFLKTMFTF